MKPQRSQTVRSWELVFPNDANPHGTMFGGKLMSIMDITAGIAASRYSRNLVVTASTESIVFKNPVKIGDRIETLARVVCTGRTSLVIKVDVFSENPKDHTRQHCTTAHFNFVALDQEGKPTPVPPLRVETDEEKREYQIAEFVKTQALERKAKMQQAGVSED
jgi:acyl-CoA thioesterase YciA